MTPHDPHRPLIFRFSVRHLRSVDIVLSIVPSSLSGDAGRLGPGYGDAPNNINMQRALHLKVEPREMGED